MESYSLKYSESIHKVLIDICKELSIPALEITFNKTRKKPMSLSALVAEQNTQKAIQSIIDKRMVKFLETIHEHDLFLSFNLQRNIMASDILLSFSEKLASAMLHFSKTQTGIKYQLNLDLESRIITPSEHVIKLLTNDPGIILIDNVVFNLDRINTLSIPVLIRKNYFLVFKECINNIKKHAKCNKVIVSWGLNKNNLFLVIEDNGKGFDSSANFDGNGL